MAPPVVGAGQGARNNGYEREGQESRNTAPLMVL